MLFSVSIVRATDICSLSALQRAVVESCVRKTIAVFFVCVREEYRPAYTGDAMQFLNVQVCCSMDIVAIVL
jgi:hypothetical protein